MSTKSRQNKGARRRQSSGFWGGRARQRAVGVSPGPKKLAVRAFLPDASQPTLGRFLSRDPIGFAGGPNLYGYARNNPTRFVDPMGLDTEVISPQPYSADDIVLDQVFGDFGVKLHVSCLCPPGTTINTKSYGAIDQISGLTNMKLMGLIVPAGPGDRTILPGSTSKFQANVAPLPLDLFTGGGTSPMQALQKWTVFTASCNCVDKCGKSVAGQATVKSSSFYSPGWLAGQYIA
jgi:hypothetical protein